MKNVDLFFCLYKSKCCWLNVLIICVLIAWVECRIFHNSSEPINRPSHTWALLWQPHSALLHCLSLELLVSSRHFIKPLIPTESSWNRPKFFKVSFPSPFCVVFRDQLYPSPPCSLVSPRQCAIFHHVGQLLAKIWHHLTPSNWWGELPLCISSRSRSFSHPEVISSPYLWNNALRGM